MNGTAHTFASLHYSSTVEKAYFIAVIRRFLISSVILYLKRSLMMAHGILHGAGLLILKSGRKVRTGGKPM